MTNVLRKSQVLKLILAIEKHKFAQNNKNNPDLVVFTIFKSDFSQFKFTFCVFAANYAYVKNEIGIIQLLPPLLGFYINKSASIFVLKTFISWSIL